MVDVVKLASIVVLAGLIALPASAQQQPRTVAGPDTTATPPGQAAPARGIVPLAIRVVISRSQDGKPAASRSYELQVPANDRAGATVGSGVQVLIPMVTQGEKVTGPVYKDVGTFIKCSATSIDGARFRLSTELEDASVMPDSKLPSDGNRGPWIQTFRTEQVLVLRDGQTTEFASGIDRISGELVKVAVTLTVLK